VSKIKKITLLIVILLIFSMGSTAVAKNKLSTSAALQIGKVFPKGEIGYYLKEGISYRTDLFIGANVDIPVVDAVGTGVDFTYTSHELKDDQAGHYKRYLWDIFFLPVNLGPIQIQPGVAWNVTDVEIPSLNLEEVSIRPAGVISAQLAIPINQHVRLTAMGRYEKIVSDLEETTDGKINISGEAVSFLSGMHVKF
jgi:hypothetical protein